MAVVQISRIQHRRGQKNSNSGIPQLSSAEFAWAVDTQELFIGNGSVAEGAPYVGNTKVLTEHDNILELASSYNFGGDLIVSSVLRPLQLKLDEYVSVADFGAVGDGAADNAAAFEAAFDALFKNSNPNYRKVLMVPNGIYNFSRDLIIPSGVLLRGETASGAVLNIVANDILFVASNGNRPININISNLTIQRIDGQLDLSGVADSVIDSVKFRGTYELGDAVSSLAIEPAAVSWTNDLEGRKVNNIKFLGCVFEANSLAVKCSQPVVLATEVKFKDCEFFVCDTAIYVEGVATQRNEWIIEDCRFEEIARNAVKMTQGRGTQILRSRFKKCGNGTNISTPVAHMVSFGEKFDNIVVDCISDRQQSAGIVDSREVAAVSEVYNADKVTFINRNHSGILLSDSFRPLAVFSAFNKFFTINYFLQLGSYSRVGKLTITVGDNLLEIQLDDQYHYSSLSIESQGGQTMTNFEFDAELRSNDEIIRPDAPNDSTSTPDTVVLVYKNPILTGVAGTISFDVAYGV